MVAEFAPDAVDQRRGHDQRRRVRARSRAGLRGERAGRPRHWRRRPPAAAPTWSTCRPTTCSTAPPPALRRVGCGAPDLGVRPVEAGRRARGRAARRIVGDGAHVVGVRAPGHRPRELGLRCLRPRRARRRARRPGEHPDLRPRPRGAPGPVRGRASPGPVPRHQRLGGGDPPRADRDRAAGPGRRPERASRPSPPPTSIVPRRARR